MRKHGGKRTAGPGKRIGRPRIDDPKIAISARVSADVAGFLKSRDNQSVTIDQIIRRSKNFREWQK